MRALTPSCRRVSRGFSLVELLVAMLLLSIAMLGVLAVFDASDRINKSEQDVADAQGAVRYGVYQMTRAIRMAGAGRRLRDPGGLEPRPIRSLPASPSARATDTTTSTGASVTDTSGTSHPVRPGTDMIEVRGVLISPLVSLRSSTGCANLHRRLRPERRTRSRAGPRSASTSTTRPQRPQFAAIDAYTTGVTAASRCSWSSRPTTTSMAAARHRPAAPAVSHSLPTTSARSRRRRRSWPSDLRER